jgi:hypothetical protein
MRASKHVLVAALAALAVACIGCSGLFGCDVDASAEADATAEAIDCGHFKIEENAASGVTCALTAQQINRPFLLHLNLAGTDSQGSYVFVRSPSGESFWFRYDNASATYQEGVDAARVVKNSQDASRERVTPEAWISSMRSWP